MARKDGWIPGLEGLRGVAALAVLVFHVWLYRDGAPATADGSDTTAAVLSSLRVWFLAFFVLSGFLLARDLRSWFADGVRVRTFALRRAARILPAYWVAMAGALLLLWGGSRADGIRLPEAEHLWTFVVLAQNYLPETVMSVNPPTWTLGVEVAFYALLPLLALLLIALRARSVVLAGVLLVGATLAVNQMAAIGEWELPARKTVLPFLGCFGVGLLAAQWRRPLRPAAADALAVAGLALAAWWMWRGFQVPIAREDGMIRALGQLPPSLGFAALVVAVASRRGAAARVLETRPLLALGALSYGVFLWHLPVLLALNRVADLPAGVLAALTLAIALVLAAASRRYVEAPALAAVNRTRVPKRGENVMLRRVTRSA